MRSKLPVVLTLVAMLSLALTRPTMMTAAQSEPPIKAASHDGARLRSTVVAANQSAHGTTASTATLGQPGLSFRYMQTFGVNEQPYLSDPQHLNSPAGLFIDASNNVYVTEDLGSRVHRYSPAGTSSLIIGMAGLQNRDTYTFDRPRDVAVDSAGGIWVVDSNRVAQYQPNGTFIQEWPPADPWASGGDNMHFNYPYGIAFDSAGRLYVSDNNNHRVQVFSFLNGSPVYSTTIGIPGVPNGDNMHFNYPERIAIDHSDRLYVVDNGNNRVQRCLFAGSWSCVPFDSGLNNPQGIAVDAANNVYIANTGGYRIRKCGSGGSCSDLASVVNWTTDVAVDSAGNIYAATSGAHVIRKFNSSGALLGTFAGIDNVPYLTDQYHYNQPRIAVDTAGGIAVIEEGGQRLVKLDSSGTPRWAVGMPGVDSDHGGVFSNPHGVAIDRTGSIYVADGCRVAFYSSGGAYEGQLGSGCGAGDYIFNWVTGIAVDDSGNIYVADANNQRVQIYDQHRNFTGRIGITGQCGTGNDHFCYPIGLDVDSAGNLYVADANNCRVQKFDSNRTYVKTFGVSGSCGNSLAEVSAEDVSVDGQGRVYVSGWNDRVQVFDSSGAYLTTIGVWGSHTSQFRGASAVDVDASGNVYVADYRNGRIEKFARGVPGWRQANINGFGDRANQWITSLTPFGGQLYAGAYNNSGSGGQLWRIAPGGTWTSVATPGFGDPHNDGADHLTEFKGKLYAGTYNTQGGQMWRSANGSTWDRVSLPGLDPSNTGIFRFLASDNLYFATWSDSSSHGTEVWRSSTGDSGTWSQVVANGFDGDANNQGVLDFEIFGGWAYAGTYNHSTGGEVWRSDNGTDWTQVNSDGFGDAGNQEVSALAAFNGYLYAVTEHQSGAGIQVWRCQICDAPGSWQKVADNGFGNPDTRQASGMEALNGYLYLAAGNAMTGMEVWRSADGTHWEQVGFGGFGDSNNDQLHWDSSLAVFNENLYVGTNNWANGGEVWGKMQQVYLPSLMRH